MTSELAVFAWLPGEMDFVPAGLLELEEDGSEVVSSSFVYGTRYLERPNRIEIDPVGLGFSRGQQVKGVKLFPPDETPLFGGIRDAAPDAWGRRVIENRAEVQANSLPESEYLLRAGANRSGALDIRRSLDAPAGEGAFGTTKKLGRLLDAARAIEEGAPVPEELSEIFAAGTSFGGMRPKAAVTDDQGRQWLAKFPSRDDRGFSVPTIEFATLKLAALCGLNVPAVQLVEAGAGRPVLLIERFDRVGTGEKPERRHYISALTLLGVHESRSPEMSYADIAERQAHFGAPDTVREQQAELYARMIFNIFVSNDDDHLRNHGFLWTGDGWALSPLFDVLPRASIAMERQLHLGVGLEGRAATLPNALTRHAVFGLDRVAALAAIDRIAKGVGHWKREFASWGVGARDIDLASSAFRHPRDIGKT